MLLDRQISSSRCTRFLSVIRRAISVSGGSYCEAIVALGPWNYVHVYSSMARTRHRSARTLILLSGVPVVRPIALPVRQSLVRPLLHLSVPNY